MVKRILISGAARPGYETQYALAWKHRIIASKYMNKTNWFPFGLFTRKHRQAYRLWFNAMERFHRYGMDVEL